MNPQGVVMKRAELHLICGKVTPIDLFLLFSVDIADSKK